MKNVTDKSCRKNQNTHFMFNNFFFNCAVYGITRKNIAELDLPEMTIWRMHIACWIPKATNTPSEYVIITAIPRQQWLHAPQCYVICALPVMLHITYYYGVNCLPEKVVAKKISDTCGINTFQSRIFQPLNLESKKVFDWLSDKFRSWPITLS